MSVKRLAKQESLGILKQTSWSSVPAANAAFKQMNWIDAGVLIPDPAVQIDQINSISQNGIHREYERFFIDGTSGLKTLPFSGIVDKVEMAPFLISALQVVSEDASTPFLKTITASGLTTPIDFYAGGGYIFTLALRQNGAAADDGVLMYNSIIDTLNIIWDLNQRGSARSVKYNGAWKSTQVLYEQSLSGSWTNTTAAENFFNKTDGWGVTYSTANFTIDGVDYSAQPIRYVEFQVNNNVAVNNVSTGGIATQYDLSPQYKFIVRLNYNDVTEKILKDFQDGTDCTFTWTNDSAAARTDGKWALACTASNPLKLMSQPKRYEGDFLGIELEMGCYSKAAATPIAIYYTDTIDGGY